MLAAFNPSGSRSPILTEAPLREADGKDTGAHSPLTLCVPGAWSQPAAVTWVVAQMTFQPRQTPSQATRRGQAHSSPPAF